MPPLLASPSSEFLPSLIIPSAPKPVRRRIRSTSKRSGYCLSFQFCPCPCGRRRFLTALVPTLTVTGNPPANAIRQPPSDPTAVLNKLHPPRPDWYEELYALLLDQGTRSYEREVAVYKKELFTQMRGKNTNVLELGVGTGPNFKYYAGSAGIHVFGVDPNKHMEKYAKAAAVAAGLPLTHFTFIQAVGEALPHGNASMDAVIGTLMLCSVEDVNMVLEEVKRVLKPGGQFIFIEHVAANDGTFLRLLQNVFDRLQQIVSDGCHLTRETGKEISGAGFSDVNINTAFLSSAPLMNSHVYGIAYK